MKRWIPILLLVLFFAIRLPGLHVPYYQDEWKNIAAAENIQTAGQFYVHPPLFEMIFVLAKNIFGVDWFRVMPLLIAGLSLWLLYIAVRNRAGQAAGLWAMGLGVFCFYTILGSLQPDVDGSFVPLCFLIALIAYDKIQALFIQAQNDKRLLLKANGWILLLFAALLVGMLIKLNFVLVVGALILDYIWEHRRDHPGIYIGRCIALGLVFTGIYIGLLYLIQALYPAFSIPLMLGHAHQFTDKAGRGWTQIAVQTVKALYYLSPLVLAPMFLVTRDVLRKLRPFLIYLILGAIFYFVLFDFSQGVLDKYLMFAAVPLLAIAGTSLTEAFRTKKATLRDILPAIVIAALIFWTNFAHPAVVALYPKTEWFGRVLHGDWNILTPITGGSGPIGFYVSFLFIAVSFIVAVAAAILARLAMNGRLGETRRAWFGPMICIVLLVGISYNIVFAEEYMNGGINGSSAKVLAADIAFINQSSLVKQVITYNDTGSGPLSLMGKYAGRIYATPEAEDMYRAKFAAYNGNYLVVDVPRLAPGSFYEQFFSRCTVLYQSVSKQISGTVYQCPQK